MYIRTLVNNAIDWLGLSGATQGQVALWQKLKKRK
jgi:hypothetical protein